MKCSMKRLIVSHTIHDDANHHFFLFDARFSNHDCKCNQGIVGYPFVAVFIVEESVPVQEIEEQSCCDAFVAVTETVVLGDEIKEVGSLLFQRRIDIFADKTLINVTDTSFERIVFFMTEQV